MTLHPQIEFWIALVSSLVTVVILGVNIVYVIKFRESVDIQRKTSQGAILLTMNNQFFYTEPHKRIIRCLEEGKSLRTKAANVTDEDLDDHIGMLDTIGTFVRAGIVDKKLVYELFSHYIESTYEAPEVADYIKQLHVRDSSLFSDFEWIYHEMKKS
jgi:hypothetical protein